MNKLFLSIPLLILLTVGVVLIARHESKNLMDEHNTTTTFTQWRTCTSTLKVAQCDDLTDETEKSKCYQASYGVSRFTFIDGDKLTAACKNFFAYQQKSLASDPINGNNYYQDCYTSQEVVEESYKSNYFYEQIYYPRYLGCAGL